jgi:peptidoglycan/xylan/chitin deacetylase (PgdA/CDA1 family)
VTASAPPAWRPSRFLVASAALHAGAGLAFAIQPAHWRAAAGVVLTSQAALLVAGLLPRCSWLGPNLRRAPLGAADDRVSLTFDDGPDPEATPRVLDLLAARGARASFFCVGDKVERHPELARRAHAEGHRIENHSHRHSNHFAFLGPTGMRLEIDRAQHAIAGIVGRRPRFFRPPAGIRNPWLDPVLARLGLRLVTWTRRGFDTVSRDGTKVATRLVRDLGPGDILLLHDRGLRDASGRPVVMAALPAVLDALARRGLRSVPLDEALGDVAG